MSICKKCGKAETVETRRYVVDGTGRTESRKVSVCLPCEDKAWAKELRDMPDVPYPF